MLTIHFLSVVTANASKNRFRENELFSENRTPLKFSFHDELFTSLFFSSSSQKQIIGWFSRWPHPIHD